MWKFLKAAAGVVRDIVRSHGDLVLENAFLRQQLAVLKRQVAHPRPDAEDRTILSMLARLLPHRWLKLLTVVQPATLLRWLRQGWRTWWRVVSGRRDQKSPRRRASSRRGPGADRASCERESPLGCEAPCRRAQEAHDLGPQEDGPADPEETQAARTPGEETNPGRRSSATTSTKTGRVTSLL